jgi:hypothetical protein
MTGRIQKWTLPNPLLYSGTFSEELRKTQHLTTIGVTAEFRTRHLLHTSQTRCHFSHLAGYTIDDN